MIESIRRTVTLQLSHSNLEYTREQARNLEDKQLSEYVLNILNSTRFQMSPRIYMVVWKSNRGNTEELRVPEDRALSFLSQYFGGR